MRRKHEDQIEQALEEGVAYLAGRIDSLIEGAANRMELPAIQLSARIGAILVGRQAVREVLGQAHSVRHLPRTTAQASEVKRPKAALAGRALPSGTRRMTEHSANVSRGAKAYWANMTPEQRRVEMNRRVEVRRKNAAAKKHRAV